MKISIKCKKKLISFRKRLTNVYIWSNPSYDNDMDKWYRETETDWKHSRIGVAEEWKKSVRQKEKPMRC